MTHHFPYNSISFEKKKFNFFCCLKMKKKNFRFARQSSNIFEIWCNPMYECVPKMIIEECILNVNTNTQHFLMRDLLSVSRFQSHCHWHCRSPSFTFVKILIYLTASVSFLICSLFVVYKVPAHSFICCGLYGIINSTAGFRCVWFALLHMHINAYS